MTNSIQENSEKTIRVRYFAALREQASRSEEIFKTQAETLAQLYSELMPRHGFSLKIDSLKFAVNNNFEANDYKISTGDEIVFIPPVAGG